MIGAALDLDAYFGRIGYAGPRTPDLTTLQAVVLHHTAAIPFENLDVLAKRGIRLDPASLQQKLVRQARGGYCFEHNLLLLDVLRALGYRASGLAARVGWGRPPGFVAPRTHMLLRVEMPEGPWIADVGFGGLTPTAPLALAPGPEQPTPHETFRLVAAGEEYGLQAQVGGWSDLYRFSLQEQMRADYEVANWFTSTYPNALFVRHLIASRADAGCRYTLFNGRFTLRRLGGAGERRMLAGAEALGAALAEHFHLARPDPAELEALAAFVAERTDAADPFDGGLL